MGQLSEMRIWWSPGDGYGRENDYVVEATRGGEGRISVCLMVLFIYLSGQSHLLLEKQKAGRSITIAVGVNGEPTGFPVAGTEQSGAKRSSPIGLFGYGSVFVARCGAHYPCTIPTPFAGFPAQPPRFQRSPTTAPCSRRTGSSMAQIGN